VSEWFPGSDEMICVTLVLIFLDLFLRQMGVRDNVLCSMVL